jgi:hypothetical protein
MGKRYFQTKNNHASFMTIQDFNQDVLVLSEMEKDMNMSSYEDNIAEFIPKNDKFIKMNFLKGIFLISNFKIISEHRFLTNYDKFDFTTFLIEEKGNNILDIETKKIDISKYKTNNNLLKKIVTGVRDSIVKNTNFDTLTDIHDVINNEENLTYFKIYCNQENENILDYVLLVEEILFFKKSEKAQRERYFHSIINEYLNNNERILIEETLLADILKNIDIDFPENLFDRVLEGNTKNNPRRD